MMKQPQYGFSLMEMIVTLVILSVVAVAVNQISMFAWRFSEASKVTQTKEQLKTIRAAIMNAAQDADNDQFLDIYTPGAENTIPAVLGLGASVKDAWGNQLLYCAGDANGSNAQYAASIGVYDRAGTKAALFSAGKDGKMDSSCASLVAQGDDLFMTISESDLRFVKGGIGGFKHDTGEMKLATTNDNVNMQNSLVTVGNFASLPTTDPQGNAIKLGTIVSNATDKQGYIYTLDGWKPFRCPNGTYSRDDGTCGPISEIKCPNGYYTRADGTCGPISEVKCPVGTYVRGDGSCGPLSEVKCPAGYYTRGDGSCGPASELQCPVGWCIKPDGGCGRPIIQLAIYSGQNGGPYWYYGGEMLAGYGGNHTGIPYYGSGTGMYDYDSYVYFSCR